MPDGDDPENWLEELFGPVIYSYPDSQAIEDGVLIPFLTPQGNDTKHRMTSNAYHALKDHHAPRYAEYADADFYRFFFAELLPLLPAAHREWRNQSILTTDFDFRVEKYSPGKEKQLWYIPNETGGVTMLLPSDY